MSTPAIVEALRALTTEIVRTEEFRTALRDVVSEMLAAPRPGAVEMVPIATFARERSLNAATVRQIKARLVKRTSMSSILVVITLLAALAVRYWRGRDRFAFVWWWRERKARKAGPPVPLEPVAVFTPGAYDAARVLTAPPRKSPDRAA